MIELTIVIAVLGVMMAIALPGFNAMRSSSSETTVKRTLESAVRVANWSFRDRADYTNADSSTLRSTTLSVLAAGTEAQSGSRVSVAVSVDKLTFYAAARSDGGSSRCYMVKQGPGGVAYYSTATAATGTCTATAATAVSAGSWGATW